MLKNITWIVLLVVVLTGCEEILIGPEPENTAEGNFDALWITMDEKYGLFPVTDVDWDSLYTVYRSQVNASTSENGLWNICCSLLSHLGNGHITLANKNYTQFYSPDSPDANIYNSVNTDLIKSKYLVNPVVTGESFITYGKIKNSTLGYIKIRSFLGADNDRDWVRDLNDVVRDLSDCDGIIIDMRNNGGGFTRNDEYAASLFIDRDIVFYFSQRKTGPGHNDFGEPIAKTVALRDDTEHYTKKNVVLTNRYTASGAEAFTLILNNLAYSTQIGDTTIGAIGEVSHVAQMPNGWTLYYPCTLTTLADGSSPEGVGIAPDILIDNTIADVEAGRDRVLERAIEYLGQ